MDYHTCPICRTQNVNRSSSGTTTEYTCPRCGRYRIQTLAENQLVNGRPSFPPLHILSGLCRNTWDILGEKLTITVDLFNSWEELDKAAQIAVPRDTDPAAKSLYLMKFIRRKTRSFADPFTFSPNELSTGFCASKHELLFCLKYLVSKGWIEEGQPQPARKGQRPAANGLTYFLTPAGWAELDRTPISSGREAQAAVSFADSESSPIWAKGFAEGLHRAGYQALRIDARLQNGKLSDEALVALRRSKLLVADLTALPPLSLFEAGFAMGIGIPVFWTCEEGDMHDKRVPLDLRQQTLITWNRTHPELFALRLANRVEAMIGRP